MLTRESFNHFEHLLSTRTRYTSRYGLPEIFSHLILFTTMQTKRVFLALVGAMLSATLAFTGCQRGEEVTGQQAGKYEINFIPAKTNTELEALRKDPNANLVRTLAQFDALVADRLTPLSKLPAGVVADFRNHIVFRDGVGVVGFKYGEIEEMLSTSELHEVMALFGLDTQNGFWGISGGSPAGRTNFAEQDYPGYYCFRVGTCMYDNKSICLSAC